MKRLSKAEVKIFKDLLAKAHPEAEAAGDDGRVITATLPDPPTDQSKDDIASNVEEPTPKDVNFVPPEWAFDMEEEESAIDVPEYIIMSKLKEKLPFPDDVEIWEIMRKPRAEDVLRNLIEASLPVDVSRITDDSKFADFIVHFLVTDFYCEDHTIPPPGLTLEDATSSPLPFVHKNLLSVIQIIAANTSCETEAGKFDINTFWQQIREHFPDFETVRAGKMTATNLIQQTQAAINEEMQATKAARTQTREGYERFVKQMQEYRSSSSEDTTGDITHTTGDISRTPEGEKSKMDATMDTTSINLRNRVAYAKVGETETVTPSGRSVRKRQSETTIQEKNANIKKTKKK